MTYLIRLNHPLQGRSLKGLVAVWDRFRVSVFGAKVFCHRWLLVDCLALFGVPWKHRLEVVCVAPLSVATLGHKC